MKVLLVDDDEAIRRVVSEVLNLFGHESIPAENGFEALSLIDSGLLVDLVMTDLNMPVMDGAVLAGQLKAKDFQKPIVFMTATPSGVPEGYPVLVKPFGIDEVFSVIQ